MAAIVEGFVVVNGDTASASYLNSWLNNAGVAVAGAAKLIGNPTATTGTRPITICILSTTTSTRCTITTIRIKTTTGSSATISIILVTTTTTTASGSTSSTTTTTRRGNPPT